MAGETGADYTEIVTVLAIDHVKLAVGDMVNRDIGDVVSVLGGETRFANRLRLALQPL